MTRLIQFSLTALAALIASPAFAHVEGGVPHIHITEHLSVPIGALLFVIGAAVGVAVHVLKERARRGEEE